VTESDAYGAAVSVANDRSPVIGGIRAALQLNAANLAGRGDTAAVVLEGSEGLLVVDAQYSLPLNIHGTRFVTRYARYGSEVIEEPFAALDIESDFTIFEAGLQQELYHHPSRFISAGLSAEARNSASFLRDTPFSPNPGTENGRARVRALRASLYWLERLEQDAFSVRVTVSGGLDMFNATDHDNSLPDSEFLKVLAQFQWLHQFDNVGQLYARAELHRSADALLPLEKFAIGGSRSVRGYRRARFVRDNAWESSIEWRYPLFRLPLPVMSPGERDGRVTVVAFVDAARGWNEDDPGRTTPTLVGAGPGLRWDVGPMLRAELYWAPFIHQLGLPSPDLQDDGVHFQVSLQRGF